MNQRIKNLLRDNMRWFVIALAALLIVCGLSIYFFYSNESTKSVAARTPQELLIENVGLAEFNPQNDATATVVSSQEKTMGQAVITAGQLAGDGTDKAKVQQAIDALGGIIKQYPDFSAVYMQRAMDLLLLGSTDYQSITQDVDNAIKFCGKGKYNIESIGCDSTAPMYALRAKVDVLSGNYQQAINDLETAVDIDPSNLGDVFNTGGVKPSDTSNPTALQEADFNAMVAQYPNDYRSYLFRGLFWNEFSFYDNSYYAPAVKDVKEAISLNPNSWVANYILGSIYQKGATWIYSWKLSGGTAAYDSARATVNQSAVQYFNIAIQLNPSSTIAYSDAAEALSELNQYPQAIADYNKVTELDPTNFGAFNDKALAEESTSSNSDYYSAIDDFSEAINLQLATSSHKYLEGSYQSRGDAYVHLNEYANAIADYSNAIGLTIANDAILMPVSQFRAIYPEFSSVSDANLVEGLRQKYDPNISPTDFAAQIAKISQPFEDSILAGLYSSRGDAYWSENNFKKAVAEYTRVAGADSTYDLNRWKMFSSNLNTTSYLDTQTLDVSTSTVSLWVRTINNNTSNYNEQNYQIDCAGKRIQSLTSVSYDAYGNELNTLGQQGWESVIPQSMGEVLYNGVCSSQ